MNILVIFTGGTIGSSCRNGWISPDFSSQQNLLNAFEKAEGATVRFSTLSPYAILSENLSADTLNRLIACLQEVDENAYDGIVVAHGTDTLLYTAAALAYTYQKTIPLALVSADYPLEDARSNGLDNFRGAVRFLSSRPETGVYVAYKNTADKEVTIHRATRLCAHREANADLYSVDNQPFAFVDIHRKQVAKNPDCKRQPVRTPLPATFCKKPKILLVESYPENGYDYDLTDCKGVVLSPYHSGTLNTASQDFQDFCLRAKKNGVPVFVVNCRRGTTYESVKAFERLSLLALPLCAKTAIFVKCWLAVSLEKELEDFLLTPLADEFCI